MNYNIDDSEDGLTFSQKQEILDKEKEIREGYKLHTIISYYPSFTKGTLMGIFGILCTLAAFLETDTEFRIFGGIFGVLAVTLYIYQLFTGHFKKPVLSIYDDHILYKPTLNIFSDKYENIPFDDITRLEKEWHFENRSLIRRDYYINITVRSWGTYRILLDGMNAPHKEIENAVSKKYVAWYYQQLINDDEIENESINLPPDVFTWDWDRM